MSRRCCIYACMYACMHPFTTTTCSIQHPCVTGLQTAPGTPGALPSIASHAKLPAGTITVMARNVQTDWARRVRDGIIAVLHAAGMPALLNLSLLAPSRAQASLGRWGNQGLVKYGVDSAALPSATFFVPEACHQALCPSQKPESTCKGMST